MVAESRRRSLSAESEAVQARALAFAAVVRGHQERSRKRGGPAWLRSRSRNDVANTRRSLERTTRSSSPRRWRSHDDTATYAQRALDLYEEVGDLAGQADMANNLGIIAYYDGRWDDTLDWYRQAVDADREDRQPARCCHHGGEHRRGARESGTSRRGRTAAFATPPGCCVPSHSFAAGFVEMHLGRLLTARGEYEAAERILRSGVEELRAMGRGGDRVRDGPASCGLPGAQRQAEGRAAR